MDLSATIDIDRPSTEVYDYVMEAAVGRARETW